MFFCSWISAFGCHCRVLRSCRQISSYKSLLSSEVARTEVARTRILFASQNSRMALRSHVFKTEFSSISANLILDFQRSVGYLSEKSLIIVELLDYGRIFDYRTNLRKNSQNIKSSQQFSVQMLTNNQVPVKFRKLSRMPLKTSTAKNSLCLYA